MLDFGVFSFVVMSDLIEDMDIALDYLVIAFIIVIVNAVLGVMWALVKMLIRLILARIAIKKGKSPEWAKPILDEAKRELKDEIKKGDKRIEKIKQKNKKR